MARPKAEKSVMWLGIFITCTFVTGMLFTALIPALDPNWSYETSQDQGHYHMPYTAQDTFAAESSISAKDACIAIPSRYGHLRTR